MEEVIQVKFQTIHETIENIPKLSPQDQDPAFLHVELELKNTQKLLKRMWLDFLKGFYCHISQSPLFSQSVNQLRIMGGGEKILVALEFCFPRMKERKFTDQELFSIVNYPEGDINLYTLDANYETLRKYFSRQQVLTLVSRADGSERLISILQLGLNFSLHDFTSLELFLLAEVGTPQFLVTSIVNYDFLISLFPKESFLYFIKSPYVEKIMSSLVVNAKFISICGMSIVIPYLRKYFLNFSEEEFHDFLVNESKKIQKETILNSELLLSLGFNEDQIFSIATSKLGRKKLAAIKTFESLISDINIFGKQALITKYLTRQGKIFSEIKFSEFLKNPENFPSITEKNIFHEMNRQKKNDFNQSATHLINNSR